MISQPAESPNSGAIGAVRSRMSRSFGRECPTEYRADIFAGGGTPCYDVAVPGAAHSVASARGLPALLESGRLVRPSGCSANCISVGSLHRIDGRTYADTNAFAQGQRMCFLFGWPDAVLDVSRVGCR